MSAEHTPKPWTWAPRTDGNAEVFHDDGVLALVFGDDADPECWPVTHNAKLIAAAPALADACEMMLNTRGCGGPGVVYEAIRAALRAAGRLP